MSSCSGIAIPLYIFGIGGVVDRGGPIYFLSMLK